MAADTTADPLAALLARRSVSPRRLAAPGLSEAQLERVIAAGLRAPDHGALVPWRALHLPAARRGELAALFADEKRRRDPLASAEDLARAREHALRAPTLFAFIACLRAGTTVPAHEQWLAAGAALGNLLNAIDALGFGAVVLSGERCADPLLGAALGLAEGERLVGFVSAGTVVKAPSAAAAKPLARAWSDWAGAPLASGVPPR